MSYLDEVVKTIQQAQAKASVNTGGGSSPEMNAKIASGTAQILRNEAENLQQSYKNKYSRKNFQEIQSAMSSLDNGIERTWLSRNASALPKWRSSIRDVDTLQKEITSLTDKLERQRMENNEQHRYMLSTMGIAPDLLFAFSAPDGAKELELKKQIERLQEEYQWSSYYHEQDMMDNIDELAAMAEEEYQAYIHSEEYAAWKLAAEQRQADYQMIQSQSGSPVVFPNAWENNAKEEELRANMEYYRSLATQKQEKAMMEKDLEELASWSETEQQALMVFAVNPYRQVLETPEAVMLLVQDHEVIRLVHKYGVQRVKEIAESFMRSQNQELAQDVSAAVAESAGSGFWKGAGHSIASVGANLIGSATSPLGYLAEGIQRTGRYSTMDPNNPGVLPGTYAGAVRGAVAEKIENSGAGKVGSTVYEAGMSALDNLTRVITAGGTGSLVLAATGAFGQTVSQYSKQGASPTEAVAMGVITGGLEVLTEKMSIDNLLKELDNPKTVKETIVAMLRSGGIEVTEEELSFLGTTLAEAAVLREKSSYNRRVAELKAYGFTDAQAREQAAFGLINEAAKTAIQSFLSGGMMSGVTSLYSNTVNRAQQKNAEKQLKETVTGAAQQIQNGKQQGTPNVTFEDGVIVDEEKMQMAERLSAYTGRQIKFYSSNNPDDGDGFYSHDGIIHVNDRGVDPVAQIISHELTHSVEMADAYKDLSAAVMKHIEQLGGNIEQMREEKRSLYARNGVPLNSDADVDSEIVASHIARHLLTNEESILSLTRENPSLGERIKNWLDGIIAKLGNKKAQERAFLRNARDAYARALEQTRAPGISQTTAPVSEAPSPAGNGGMTIEETKEWAREELNAGRMDEETFDSIMDEILEYEEQNGIDGMAEEDRRFAEKKFSVQNQKDGAEAEAIHNAYQGKTLSADSEIYSYDFLTSMPDMQTVLVPGVDDVRNEAGRIDAAKVIDAGIKNALSIGTERDGKVYVKNRYTGRDLRVDVSSIRHGLNGSMSRLLTNARLGSVIGDVIQNAIPINALHNTADGVEGTYAMAGYAVDEQGREFVAIITVEQRSGNVSGIDTYDVTHAISGRQKRGNQLDTKSQGVYPTLAASNINIKDLLSVVKGTYQSILSDDVLDHFGETKNVDGHYYGRAKFSISESTINKRDVAKQLQAIIDRGGDTAELQRYVQSLHGGPTSNSRSTEDIRKSGAKEILRAAKAQNISVDEYLRQNWEQYDVDGEWNAEAREALDMERRGRRQFSFTQSEIRNIQGIGKKSVNSFTSVDIKTTERFAQQYWEEMGIKSPFFRAWFGDWRANDKTLVQVADQQGDTRGIQKNEDTGWDIQVSGKVFNESGHRAQKNQNAIPYLQYINDIINKAVLLDSYGIGTGKVKSENSLLMHSMYAIADIGNGPELLKLYVEEMNDPNRDNTSKRAYQLQNIEKQQLGVQGSGINPSPITPTATIKTVADLHAVVKQHDLDFSPKPTSVVFDQDGMPKEIYHGTSNSGFTVFNTYGGKFGLFGRGSYFTDDPEVADSYTHKGKGQKPGVYGVYLNIKNPLDMDAKADLNAWKKAFKNADLDPSYLDGVVTNEHAFQQLKENLVDEEYARWEAEDIVTELIEGMGYDGITHIGGGRYGSKDGPNHRVYIAFEPEQIKSSTENIGTFDGNNPDIRYSFSERDETIISDIEQQLKGGATNVYGYEVAGFDEGEAGVRNPAVLIRKPGETGNPTRYNLSATDNSEENIVRKAAEIIEEDYRKQQAATQADNAPLDETGKEAESQQNARENLPTKARNYLHRAENTLLDSIGKNLHVSRFARREYLRPIVEEISNEYLRTGTVSDEKTDLLFDKAYAEGIVVDREFYDQYKHIKDYLRTTGVTISTRDQSDIADFGIFRRQAWGTVRIVNEGGLPVDSAYHELNGMAPELFPENITHPADQLQRMYEVGDSIRISQVPLERYYANNGMTREEFRQGVKETFLSNVDTLMHELREVKRYVDDREKQETIPTEISEEEAADLYVELKAARKNYEKVNAKNILTAHDEMQVGRLLRGEILLEHLDPATDNVKGIKAIFEAKKEYERISKILAAYKQQRKVKYIQLADRYLETANVWKDKRTGIAYSRETMRRNIYDIVPDKELAKQITEEYFEAVQISEAMATRFKTEYRNRVRDLGLSQKVEKGNLVSEAHAVQLLGEAMDNIRVMEASKGRIKNRDGKSLSEWRDVVDNLWLENKGLDKAKIEDAVQQFRKIYDDLFQKMNRVRVQNGYEPVNYRQGYFPHFQPGDGDGIMVHFGKALGIDTHVDTLPTTINGMTQTFRPGIQWFGNAQERLGFSTAYDAVEGFDKYIEGVSNVIFHTENIQKLRALASRTRYRTSEEGIRMRVDRVQSDPRLTFEEKQVQIRDIYDNGKFELSNFVAELDEYTNLLAGKKSRFDRGMEAMIGRRAYTIMKNWESRVGANMIAGNLTSAMTNFIPLTQAGARLDRGLILSGMWDTLKAIRQDDGFVGMSDFLTNRRGSESLVQTWVQKASAVMGTPMELIDNFTSEALVRAAYQQNLRRGLSEKEAMHQADIFASNVMADRSKGAMPTLLESKNPLFKAFTQFQLEVNNQYSEIFKDLPREYKDKSIAAFGLMLLKYFLGAFLYNEVYEYFIGRRPALDPFGMLNSVVGDVTGYELPNLVELGVGAVKGEEVSFETEQVGIGGAGSNLANEALSALPFSAGLTMIGIETDGGRIPAASAVPDFSALWEAATEKELTGEQRWKMIQDELNKLAYIIPPFGGNQISKIWKGIDAFAQGGSYSLNQKGEEILQYPVYKDDPQDAFWSMARATLFGKSALPEAQAWANQGYNSLSAEETAAYKDMLNVDITDRKAYAFVDELRSAEVPIGTKPEERAAVLRGIKEGIILGSDISDAGKAIAFYGLVASDSEKKLMNALADAGADQTGLAKFMIGLRSAKALKGTDRREALRDLIVSSPLAEEEKMVIVGDILGTDMLTDKGNPSQYAKFLSAVEDGLSVDKYMELYGKNINIDDYLELKDKGLSTIGATDLAITLADLKLGLEAEEDSEIWIQQCDAILGAGISEADQVSALEIVSREPTGRKIRIGYENGISPDTFIELKKVLPDFDANGNGSYTQAEVTAAIDAMSDGNKDAFSVLMGIGNEGMNLTNEQKAVLWQLQTGAKDGKKNPYDKDIGKYIYDLVKARQEESKLEKETEKDSTPKETNGTTAVEIPAWQRALMEQWKKK